MPALVPALFLRFNPTEPQESRELIAASLLDFQTAAVHEVSDTEWRVFFRAAEERDRAAGVLSHHCVVSAIDVPDEDWARRSQQDLRAIAVGDLVIAPPWDTNWPLASDLGHLIVIAPSTGFGTGHHPTTRLCLWALQQIDLRGKRVLDVGTGSGVLAIAAAKLGASQVTAVDDDPDAIAAARDNVRRNGVEVDLRVAGLEQAQLERADVVLANLTGAMLQRVAAMLASLARGGVVIVSGLLEEEEAIVSAAFAPSAATISRDHESGWLALTLSVP